MSKAGDGKPAGAVALRAFPQADRQIATAVATLMREQGIDVEELYVEKGRLDDVFRQITSSEGARRNA